MISSSRLTQNFALMDKIGRDEHGGITRLAFSDEDFSARALVIEFMKTAGLTIRTDAFGNVIGRKEGLNPLAPVVMVGSHIDSVPQGGNYDGVVGVLGAIEALSCLKDEKVANYHPIEVIVFMAEESSRFGAATLGSKAFLGKLSEEHLDKYQDKQGISLREALILRNLKPEEIRRPYPNQLKCFLELHIEQGKVLETKEIKLGIVEAIAAPTRFNLTISGEADHSGATPMNMRQDALAAAAEVILLVEKLAQAEGQYGTVGTVGVVSAEPGVMNVIPGKATLGIDIRGISKESKQRVIEGFQRGLEDIMLRRKVCSQITYLSDEEPVQLSAKLTEFLSDICQKESISHIKMPSGAGHDAMHFAEFTPTGMLFIPCRGGISHNPAEYAKVEDITAGTKVLYEAIRELAKEDMVLL